MGGKIGSTSGIPMPLHHFVPSSTLHRTPSPTSRTFCGVPYAHANPYQKVSAIIHKRVSFVLCTADAVKYNTQKVRKALKHGIPLVSQVNYSIRSCTCGCDVENRVCDRIVLFIRATWWCFCFR